MPLIDEKELSEASDETRKQELIRKIQQLPEDILESKELYDIELITLKCQMQYDSWLVGQYKHCRVLSSDEHWLRFEIGEWTIAMEGEERNE